MAKLPVLPAAADGCAKGNAERQGRAGFVQTPVPCSPPRSTSRSNSLQTLGLWEWRQSQRGWVWSRTCESQRGVNLVLQKELEVPQEQRGQHGSNVQMEFCLWPWPQRRENVPALPWTRLCPLPGTQPSTALLLTPDSGKITHHCFHFWCSANDRSRSASSAAEDRVLGLIRSGRAWNPQLVILAWLAESGRYFRWTHVNSRLSVFEVSSTTNNKRHLRNTGEAKVDGLIFITPPLKPSKAKNCRKHKRKTQNKKCRIKNSAALSKWWINFSV